MMGNDVFQGFFSFLFLVPHFWPRKFSSVHLSSNPISLACELLALARQTMCRRSSGTSLCSHCQLCCEAATSGLSAERDFSAPRYQSCNLLRQKVTEGLSSGQDLLKHPRSVFSRHLAPLLLMKESLS